MTSALRIIVTGLIGQHHRLGGVTWDYLHYPLGLLHLGHDVYYFEDSGEWPYVFDLEDAADETWRARDCGDNVRHLEAVMTRFGLSERWAYRDALTADWHGLPEAARKEIIRSADLVLNVSGTLQWPAQYRGRGKLVYIDSDPVFTQLRHAREPLIAARVDAHDVFFTFGETLRPPFLLDRQWHPTRQPIVLSEWADAGVAHEVYTTVMSWTSYPPIVWNGRSYGQKDVEFKACAALPRLVPSLALEVAMTTTLVHSTWQDVDGSWRLPDDVQKSVQPTDGTADILCRAGWRIADALEVCSTVDDYRRYICSSKGEWSIAKNGYVAGATGWFSCRSACYLAAGRPVVVQDTGFSSVLPTGEGIVAFTNLDEAAAGLRDVQARYDRHSRAARELAHEYFSAEKVLTDLLERALLATDSVRTVPA